MDRLEEHIRQNREDLDRYNPPAHTWNRIKKNLRKGKNRRRWINIAAMVVIILGTAVIFYRSGSKTRSEKLSTGEYAQSSPQLHETEIYYNNLINSLYREATPLLTNNPDLRNELNSDLIHLDSICIELKKDLKDNISNQEVVQALIMNYRIKIHILEDMLSVLKEGKTNTEKKKNHEL